ncbi:hypothetical protein BVC80_8643g16 [Macleaya cordata]|uniref:Uncharacterized protein n=1 Tax=Macleaya cordata TaxID=56857 RepID=A0A200R8L5_MACCD|nr:hypothetical protein BVC80_8643g16 [Macleaya cordata]
MLSVEGMHLGLSPWRFELMWLEDEGLPQLIKEWWDPSYIFCKKLQRLKDYLKQWNCDTFGRIDKKIEVILGKITAVDLKEEQNQITLGERCERENWRKEFTSLSKLEGIREHQRAKDIWGGGW